LSTRFPARFRKSKEVHTKILIADDDTTTLMMLRSTLATLGYHVESACDGDQAWSALQSLGAPELAILDWLMPGMTGPVICRKLRERTNGPYVYVILLTAMDKLNDLVEGIEAGADDYITKPFKPQELRARLRAGRRILELQHELLAAQTELEIRATHDGLTGLWNHGAIIERLSGELDRAKREKMPVGVILFDLDHFKQVNDTYGHSVGDQVLRESAHRIKAVLRPYDLVGRYGGEEFLTVAPGCDLRSAAEVAERVRNALSVTPVVLPAGQLFITASAGVSAASAEDMPEASAMIDAADRALYRAKGTGRNRVEWFAPEEFAERDKGRRSQSG
jgi:two-component system cell cycle response regulator